MEIKTLLLPITDLPADWICHRFPHGYANGYIGVPRDHPWHGKDYDEIDRIVTIHGGLTYGRGRTPLGEPDGNWWLGFDTCHPNDNELTCDQAYCEVQVEFLKQQAIEAASNVRLNSPARCEMRAKTIAVMEQLPIELQQFCSYMAYERGHSAGEEEVESLTFSIASDLLSAYQRLQKRLTELPVKGKTVLTHYPGCPAIEGKPVCTCGGRSA